MSGFVRRHLALLLALVALVPGALWQLALAARIVASRLSYPMDLEWMEGGALYQAHRLLHGEALYGDPAAGFVPFPYPPLHAVVLALAGRLFTLDFATGRAVSILCFGLVLGVCAWEVLRHARRRSVALLGATALLGYVAATLPVVSSWYDLVRNDSLALALPLLAAACVSERLSATRVVACAVLLSLGFFTKQTALFFVGFLVLAVFPRSPRLGLVLIAVTGGLCGAAFLALQWATDGWFLSWINVQNTHPVDAWRLWQGTRLVLAFAPFLPVVLLLAAWLRREGRLSIRSRVWLAMLAGAVPASLVPYWKVGGFDNNLIPLLVVGGLVSALVVIDGFEALVAQPRRAAAPWREPAVATALAFFGALFFLAHRYDPRVFVPSPALRARAEALNALVAGLEGRVVMPSHPFLPIRNGKANEQMHVMSWWDAYHSPLAPRLDLDAFFARSAADWLLAAPVDLQLTPLAEQVERRFRLERRLSDPARTLVGAAPTGPELLFRSRAPAAAAAGAAAAVRRRAGARAARRSPP
jgi:hypothetical protein